MVLAFFVFAEEEGFEPPVPRGTTVFKTAAFDHSATPLCNIGLHPNRMLRFFFVFHSGRSIRRVRQGHSATPLCNIGLHPNRMLRYQNSFSRPYSSRSCPRNWNAKIVYLMN